MYLMAKHLHMTAVALSILLFVLRFVWAEFNPQVLQKKWAKIMPHIIDTVLLASAIWLCVLLSQYPIANAWLTVKVIGVVLYILLGMVALKWARGSKMRWVGFAAALGVLALTAKVAVTKQPLLF